MLLGAATPLHQKRVSHSMNMMIFTSIIIVIIIIIINIIIVIFMS